MCKKTNVARRWNSTSRNILHTIFRVLLVVFVTTHVLCQCNAFIFKGLTSTVDTRQGRHTVRSKTARSLPPVSPSLPKQQDLRNKKDALPTKSCVALMGTNITDSSIRSDGQSATDADGVRKDVGAVRVSFVRCQHTL